jgi:RNA polymerase sigma factor (sigma-70 family)
MAWITTRPSLLSRIRESDDQTAWVEFDRRYSNLILRYCIRYGLSYSDAEDVRQTVLMNLARALKRFEYDAKRGRFRSYLGRVVRNAITRTSTRPNRAEIALSSSEPEAMAEAAEAEKRWEAEWVAHHLRTAMRSVRQTFDPRSVQAFELLLAGRTPAEIATHLDLSADAVHKIKQRIRGRLQELIAEQIDEEESLE